MSKNLLFLLTSSAFVGLVSILINFYQWHVKVKHDINEEEREQLYDEIEYYRIKFRNDENEIDRLKEEIRKLKATKKGGCNVLIHPSKLRQFWEAYFYG